MTDWLPIAGSRGRLHRWGNGVTWCGRVGLAGTEVEGPLCGACRRAVPVVAWREQCRIRHRTIGHAVRRMTAAVEAVLGARGDRSRGPDGRYRRAGLGGGT